jgi:hypothetical protein
MELGNLPILIRASSALGETGLGIQVHLCYGCDRNLTFITKDVYL